MHPFTFQDQENQSTHRHKMYLMGNCSCAFYTLDLTLNMILADILYHVQIKLNQDWLTINMQLFRSSIHWTDGLFIVQIKQEGSTHILPTHTAQTFFCIWLQHMIYNHNNPAWCSVSCEISHKGWTVSTLKLADWYMSSVSPLFFTFQNKNF